MRRLRERGCKQQADRENGCQRFFPGTYEAIGHWFGPFIVTLPGWLFQLTGVTAHGIASRKYCSLNFREQYF
jgi:hypothetical protein